MRCIGEAARDAACHALVVSETMKAFRGALAGDEGTVALVDIAGEQLRTVGVGAAHHQGRHAAHVGGEARRAQIANVGCGRN